MPVTSQEVFAGRSSQIQAVTDVLTQGGRHAIIYGDRGVGKTSLARVCREIIADAKIEPPFQTAYYTCNAGDSFGSMWTSIFKDMHVNQTKNGVGFTSTGGVAVSSAAEFLSSDEPSVDEVRRILTHLASTSAVAIFVDEFDRPTSKAFQSAVTDLIKVLADNEVRVTLILVGVGETVGELLSEHESVHRSLRQIHMPLMGYKELAKIVLTGMHRGGLTVEDAFVHKTVLLSLGLPHYTHLISQYGAYAAIEADRKEVQAADFQDAVTEAIEQAAQSIRDTYFRAVSSNRETLYDAVLLACATAQTDGSGTFGAPDVREKLREITGRDLDIPAFATHLNDFSSSEHPRGKVLAKRGTSRRFRYKFRDPLMPPFVLMKGLTTGKISTESLDGPAASLGDKLSYS